MSADPSSRALRLRQAFDELQFGPTKTLNLRDQRPTVAEAVQRTERWLRERQMSRAGEVLVITGRGNNSDGGISPVREAVRHLLTTLKRRGVLTAIHEHTAGSFVVRLAPVAALFDAARRKRETAPLPPRDRDPAALQGLGQPTRQLLRRLAERSLEMLGTHGLNGRFVTDEMVRHFTALAAAVPEGPDREARLQQAIAAALDELESDR